jgi:cysteine desulfurase
MNTPIYLDNAATSPLHPEVIEAMVASMKSVYGNPSSTHALGRIARTEIEKARKTVASLLGCSPSEVFFTSGGTEADNMALRCGVRDLGVKHLISSKIEHHAITHTIDELEKEGAVTVSYVGVSPKGILQLEELEELLKMHPNSMVSLMHANNEIGNLIDLQEIGGMCKKYGAYFHSDTVQTIGQYAFQLNEIPVDIINGAAHKFNGPKGVGFIYIRSGLAMKPILHGGAQERNMRGGTENVYGIIGLAKALELAYRDLDEKQQHLRRLKNHMINSLLESIPGVSFNGDYDGSSLNSVLNVSLPPSPNSEMILFNLDIAGICASGGSACSSGSAIGSHVLAELGVPSERAAVRFSFGKQTTIEEVDFAVKTLRKILIPA